jgi:hypothetical protein
MLKLNEEIKIKEYGILSHMNMTKSHISKYSGIFECEGKPLHGKKFFHESETEMKGFMEYGKTTSLFYLDEPDSQSFKTIKELISHYNTEFKTNKQ